MSTIDSYIQTYGAAIVKFDNQLNGVTGTYTHYIVFVGFDRTKTNFEERYIVLDPASTSSSGAGGVRFGECASYSPSPSGATFKYNSSMIKSVLAYY